jgi:hypothetical protein
MDSLSVAAVAAAATQLFRKRAGAAA